MQVLPSNAIITHTVEDIRRWMSDKNGGNIDGKDNDDDNVNVNDTNNNNKVKKLFVFWCREHWTVLMLAGRNWEFYDSAPSIPVLKDLRRLMGEIPYDIMRAPRQRRGSFECGFFVCAAIFARLNMKRLVEGQVSLARAAKEFKAGKPYDRRWWSPAMLPTTRRNEPYDISGGDQVVTLKSLENYAASKNNCWVLTAIQVVEHYLKVSGQPPIRFKWTTQEFDRLSRLIRTRVQRRHREVFTQHDIGDALLEMEKMKLAKFCYLIDAIPNGDEKYAIINFNDTCEGEMSPQWKCVASVFYERHGQLSGHYTFKEAAGGMVGVWMKAERNVAFQEPSLTAEEARPKLIPQQETPSVMPKILKKSPQSDDDAIPQHMVTSRPKPHALIRPAKALAMMKIAKQGFKLHWKTTNGVGQWWGKPNDEGGLTFTAERCQACGERRKMEDLQLQNLNGVTVLDLVIGEEENENECLCDTPQGREKPVYEEVWTSKEEMEPKNEPVIAGTSSLKGSFLKRFKIGPNNVHRLVWRELAEQTRSNHLSWLNKLTNLDPELSKAPLGWAIVEFVLRIAKNRNHAWSTVSSSLSAIASAFRQLPLYSNAANGIELKKDPTFAAAAKRAQKLARTAAPTTSLSTPCSLEQMNDAAGKLPLSSRLLLWMCWHFAARVGDMRQVHHRDVALPQEREGSVKVVFRYGKGGAFWGPYTIMANLPSSVIKMFQEWCRSHTKGPLWSVADQKRVSEVMAEQGLSLRSIRRGALIHHAQKGAEDSDIQLLSGHKRSDTLMRYLGWGSESSTAAKAARRRGIIGGETKGGLYEPTLMGPNSGFVGKKGQRVAAAPKLFRERPPTNQELGLKVEKDWPIHVKNVGTIDTNKLTKLAPRSLKEQWLSSLKFLTQEYLGQFRQHGSKVPKSKFTQEQIDVMLKAGKIEVWEGEVLGTVNAFLIIEALKERQRPIGEPYLNKLIPEEDIPRLRYPSRTRRRADIAGKKYLIEFDFAAYFDQFELPEEIRGYFVFRVGDKKYALRRLPMGATFSPAIAQLATWILTHGIGTEEVTVSTMIDNVLIASDHAEGFIKAVRTFTRRTQLVNATLNEEPPKEDTELLLIGRKNHGGIDFLGEHFAYGTVKNTSKLTLKLTKAMEVFRQGPTRRQAAALIGLIFYMGHTLGVNFSRYHSILKWYRRLSMLTKLREWDAPLPSQVPQKTMEEIENVVRVLIENKAREIPERQTVPNEEHYDAKIIIDACGKGWAAQVLTRGKSYLLKQAWTKEHKHSAHSEPTAVARCLKWVYLLGGIRKICVVTDHIALVTGQKRWESSNGGFSSAFHLNEAFRMAYNLFDRTEFFYVEGTKNPADGPSRDDKNTYELKVEMLEETTSWNIHEYEHPYREPDREQMW